MAYPSHLASQIFRFISFLTLLSCFSFRKSERQQFGRRCNVDLPLGQVKSYQCRFPARWPIPWRPTPTPFKIQAQTSSCFCTLDQHQHIGNLGIEGWTWRSLTAQEQLSHTTSRQSIPWEKAWCPGQPKHSCKVPQFVVLLGGIKAPS